MRWSFLNNSIVPLRKFFGGAMALEKGIDQTNALINMGISSYLNYNNQRALLDHQQKWTEDMYTKYQSPEALMRQYREAGLNPYLMSEGSGGVGQIPSSPSIGAPGLSASDSGSVVGQFNQYELNAAMAGNQRAQTALNYITAINDAFIKGGYESGLSMVNQYIPGFRSLGMDSHEVMKMTRSVRISAAAKSEMDSITSEWFKKYGKESMTTNLEAVNQSIAESVGRLGLMSSQSDLNRQKVKESNSVIVRNVAEAFKLKEEGGLYHVNADTARQIQRYVVSMYASQASMLGHAEQRDSALFSSQADLLSWYESLEARGQMLSAGQIDVAQQSDYLHRLIKMTLEDLGNVIHVNGNFSWSDVNGAFNNYSESNSNFNTNQNYNMKMK